MRKRPQHQTPVKAAGPTPLIAIAGLPKDLAEPTKRAIKNEYGWSAVVVPFEGQNGYLYQSSGAIKDLMRQVCAFAQKQDQKNAGERIPAPSRIILAYVHDGDWRHLLRSFGYSVAPARLQVAEWDFREGKHWRFSSETVLAAIKLLFSNLDSHPIQTLRSRIEAPSTSEVLVLPARNFLLEKGEKLADRFDRLMDETLSLGDLDKDIKAQKFIFDRLPAYYGHLHIKDKWYHIDDRDLVFPWSRSGMHGPMRTATFRADTSVDEFRRLLESCYRFGSPMDSGFQHDVQFEKDKLLNKQIFSCSEKGDIPISGSHANIYPNDAVR